MYYPLRKNVRGPIRQDFPTLWMGKTACSSRLGSGIISLRGYVNKGDTGQRVLDLTNPQLSHYVDA